MNTIRVNCPECHSSVSVDKEKLLATQGHTVCPECLHTFKLVKKSKAEAAKNDRTPAEKTAAASKEHATDKPAEKPAAKKSEKTARSAQKPLNYRIPKAETQARGFSEVGSDAFAFNLLDRDSISSQLPQVSIKPAAQSLTHAPMHQEGQQNHITIHTDSLVFTLVGDGQAPMMPQSSSMAVAPIGGNLPVAAQPAAVLPQQQIVMAAGNETNWTIATIAALVVLIIQLFYLIMMLL